MTEDEKNIVPLADLALKEKQQRLLAENDELVLVEFRQMLVRQQEQDLALERLRGVVQTLSAGVVASMDEILVLRETVATLERHHLEMLSRQGSIARMCDALAESIRGVTEP